MWTGKPWSLSETLAEFLVTGRWYSSGMGPKVSLELGLEPIKLNKGYRAEIRPLLEDALAGIGALPPAYASGKMGHTVDLLKLYSRLLMNMGELDESIAKLQFILDKYPGIQESDAVERRIQDLMEASKQLERMRGGEVTQ